MDHNHSQNRYYSDALLHTLSKLYSSHKFYMIVILSDLSSFKLFFCCFIDSVVSMNFASLSWSFDINLNRDAFCLICRHAAEGLRPPGQEEFKTARRPLALGPRTWLIDLQAIE